MADNSPSLQAPPLDQPLPVELTGRAQGWFGRYRRYPVFSAPWVRGRQRAWGIGLAVFMLNVVAVTWFAGPDEAPWGAVVQILLQLGLPLLAGPWLGLWVRRQGWAPRREIGALAAALLAVALGMGLLSHFGSEPLKQFIAEQTGAVDENGQRRRVMMMIGISISSPDDHRNSAGPAAPRRPDGVHWASLASGGLLSLWLGGGLALWGWQRERTALQALARERELATAQAQRRDAELRLSVLAAQVEPHFLFNTLAGVRSAIATDPARAADMVDGLVDYLRASIPRLRSDGAAQATVSGQFDIVRAYLGLMAARMPRLKFSVQVPDDLQRAHCPPLMLISLAENAVRHGVELKMGPARIDVSAARADDGRLVVTVADDGVGFGVSQSGSGIGLTNIRERLLQLYGGRAELTLKARPEGGVAAAIALPLEWPEQT